MVKIAAINSDFSQLEQAVLAEIGRMYPPIRDVLEGQLVTAKVVSRKNTGAGFYTYFSVARISGTEIQGENPMHGPKAWIDGLEEGMGFLLWLKDGFADCLEGFSYIDDTTEIAFDTVVFALP